MKTSALIGVHTSTLLRVLSTLCEGNTVNTVLWTFGGNLYSIAARFICPLPLEPATSLEAGLDAMIEAGKIGSNSPESSKTNPVATNITQMKTAELKAKLPRKITDFSMYMNEAKLTDKQQECFSLKMEYGITVSEIARRLRISRTVVDEHIAAAKRRIDQARGNQAQARKAAKYKQE